ncbi:MAG: bifunctional (p)ppGpp synthetase/guanosine-3',5'-bis(diphosphate) 3'-pyrophosphohydrolase [Clostridia bacterium]|nr:bifunctional (p)ppGpp synthetase/guanosine-3',5'-bis(diphosphate) 3'-pyrophosphohydrolase [Clostridia bacterium]
MELAVDLIRSLNEKLTQCDRGYDMERIGRAVEVASEGHKGQYRRSGEEYICHPLNVAIILCELGMDSETIVAGLLHDVVEDTAMETAEVEREFGKDVALLVDGVTKITKIDFFSKEEQQAENVRKMFMAMGKDVRVIIIKLADRLHNMRTSHGWEPQKQRDKAKETLDIYAPLAHRFGMRAVKEELEDLSLRILDPVAYAEIEQALENRRRTRSDLLESVQERLRERLTEHGIKPFVAGRVKSIPGIYRKMYMQQKTFDEIYDVYAVRVIVETDTDCYNVLGHVHEMFRPLPNRFKDYISTPKSNMYQSLHTTVLGKEKIPFEVQIRTWEMHYTAEYGIAAHWKYKLGIRGKDRLEQRIAWVREFLESQEDANDSAELVNTIRTDLTDDDVFVFTPKGDVISLPSGSTVIDFAYAIHSAVGNRMVGAKIDNRLVPLDTTVDTGQIVEIVTTSAPGHGPSRDWMKIVKTGEARSKIRQWFKKEKREENIEEGRNAFEAELARNYIRLNSEQYDKMLEAEMRRQHCSTADDFFAAIGYGGILLSRVIPRLRDEYARAAKEEEKVRELTNANRTVKHKSSKGGVIVENMENCLVKFARCCDPLPGDEIIGFITRGFGVSVHKRDCPNVPADLQACEQPERWVRAEWEDRVSSSFKVSLHLEIRDRDRLIADVTTQLALMHVAIYSINAREPKDDHGDMHITVGVNGTDQLEMVIARLSKVSGVLSVTRAGNHR